MTDRMLVEIAQRYGTPCYVYDLESISQQIAKLKQALPEAEIYYALKANSSGGIIRHMAQHGLGAEVISLGELARALQANLNKLILTGPGHPDAFRKAALQAAYRKDIRVSLDSISQWQAWQSLAWPQKLGFLIRLNPALDPKTHEHLATGMASSKFGMSLAEAEAVACEIPSEHFLGFHVHAGSQIGELHIFSEVFERLAPLYERFKARYLDIGGGYHVPDFPLEAYAHLLRGFAERFKLRLMLEPGRYLVADSGFLLTSVLHLKEGERHHIICDAGMAELLRPALYGAKHPIRALTVGAF
ncbi:MAG: alanine racemase [Deinococcales bacterium]